ncbi:TPA: heme-binding protein [Burkholderia cenocepacia]|nr:heme-binding protein [Burkholderia cenocepacia]
MNDIALTRTLTEQAIKKMLDAAIAAAQGAGTPVGVAIVDSSCRLRAWFLMDGATPLVCDVVPKKARSAVFLRMPSGADELPAELFSAFSAASSEFTSLKGGLPIFSEGQLVGAIAAGGGSHEYDEKIARAGLDSLSL